MIDEGACSYRQVIKSMCGLNTPFPSEGKSVFFVFLSSAGSSRVVWVVGVLLLGE